MKHIRDYVTCSQRVNNATNQESLAQAQDRAKEQAKAAHHSALEEISTLVGLPKEILGFLEQEEATRFISNASEGLTTNSAARTFLWGRWVRNNGAWPSIEMKERFDELEEISGEEQFNLTLKEHGYSLDTKTIKVGKVMTIGWGIEGSILGGVPYSSWYDDVHEVPITEPLKQGYRLVPNY